MWKEDRQTMTTELVQVIDHHGPITAAYMDMQVLPQVGNYLEIDREGQREMYIVKDIVHRIPEGPKMGSRSLEAPIIIVQRVNFQYDKDNPILGGSMALAKWKQ